MRPERQPRKLTALLSASADGYGDHVQRDEASAVETLRTRARVIEAAVERHRGRIAESTSSGVLAEFPNVGDALTCAIESQNEIGAHDAAVSEDLRLPFRIGIHLGEVVEEQGRIYGEGVHVAALVAGVADPGGVCISTTARDHVKNQAGISYQDLGNQDADDVSEPVRVYRVLLEPEGAARKIGRVWSRLKRRQKIGLALAVALAQGAGGLLVKRYIERPAPVTATAQQQTSVAPPTDKSSVAVLPFDNMTGDPEQAYFADGFAEQLITALSNVPALSVVSRNSSFTYKGKAVAVPQIARELGVRYVLEGSVQKASNRVRINVQLIDGLSGQHVWADSYDRELKDIFALEDELILKILPPLQVRVGSNVTAGYGRGRTSNINAYLKVMQCGYALREGSRASIALARRVGEEAIALDPDYPNAYSCLGAVQFSDLYYGASRPGEGIASAIALHEKALAMDGSLANTRSRLGTLYSFVGRYEDGIAEAQKTVELIPNCTDCYYFLSIVLKYAGRFQDAIAANQQALRLEPMLPDVYVMHLASIQFLAGDCAAALATADKRAKREENLPSHALTAATYAGCGRDREARSEAAEVLRLNPKFSVAVHTHPMPYRNPADRERLAEAMRKAGLPP